MKKCFNKFGILLCLVMLLSCSKDWLDKKPDISVTVPETLKDCQALLDNVSKINHTSPALGETASDGHFILETAIPNLSSNIRNAYTWSKEEPYLAVSDWATSSRSGSYFNVFTCNLILETLSKMSVSSLDLQEFYNVKGQALFIRSRAFYELAQLYAPPYKIGSSNSDLGIPLRLESDVNIPSVRATVEENYDRIVSDLVQSSSLLPETASYKTRASKVAAFALLARCLLSMEDYNGAAIYSDSALAIYSNLMDYNTLNASAPYPISVLNEEVIFHSLLLNYTDNTVRTRIDKEVIDLYDINDRRLKVFFTFSAGQAIFKGYYYGARSIFNGLATDELYLIRAECYARAGDKGRAMLYLNSLYRKRWDSNEPYSELTAIDADDALRQVLVERRKQLLLRGLRWTDLRRLNADSRFAVTLSRNVLGKTYILEPGSYRYTFPIPDDIIQNTGMPQNPGWDN